MKSSVQGDGNNDAYDKEHGNLKNAVLSANRTKVPLVLTVEEMDRQHRRNADDQDEDHQR